MIVGRSNVGKSTLYNRLLGKKEAITGDEYGLTRDYQVERCILNDIEFNLTDTAGFNIKKSELSKKVNNTIVNFKPEIILHLAAQAGVRYSLIAPKKYLSSNINGTFNIIEAAKNTKVKHLLIASSSSVYGLSKKKKI